MFEKISMNFISCEGRPKSGDEAMQFQPLNVQGSNFRLRLVVFHIW